MAETEAIPAALVVAVAPAADQQAQQAAVVMIKEQVAVAPEAHLIQEVYWEAV